MHATLNNRHDLYSPHSIEQRLKRKRKSYMNRVGQRYLALAIALAIGIIPLTMLKAALPFEIEPVIIAIYFVTVFIGLAAIAHLMLAYLD